jgi:DNA polymerase-4
MAILIMHIDIDAFFASIEQVRNPRLRGRPVIVGAGCIASCSYEARRFGLRAGMSLRRARELCPQAVVLEGSQHVYAAFAEKVWARCRELTPDMETLLDDAYLDLTGTERLNGDVRAAAMRLKEDIRRDTGLTVTIGIASSRVAARIASSLGKPDGLVIVEPGQELAVMGPLPMEKLPGVGHATAEVLHKMNITTIGELAALPAWSLDSLFGARGAALYERAHGRDSQVIARREIPQSISRETSFHRDTADRGEIEGMLYYLVERAMRTLRSLGLVARTVETRIRYSDMKGEHAARSMSRWTGLDGEAFDFARGMLNGLYRRRVSLHGVGVTISNFRPAGSQQAGLFDEDNRRRLEGLYRALDEVRSRYGYGAIVAGKSLELLRRLPRNDYGFTLRTPSLTK